MCGIVGFYNNDEIEVSRESLVSMSRCVSHRGPDDEGYFMAGDHDDCIQDRSHVGLGHQRLSILDLSKAGHQPMSSRDGRYVIVFNGEIYNHHKIREGIRDENPERGFVSSSDTETILEAFALWGPNCINQFVGMFAFGLYDSLEEKLIVCRDRIGIKPLYYFWDGVHFAFASELNAVKPFPFFNQSLRQESIAFYLAYGYIPSPWTIFDNCYKLMPGEILTLSKMGLKIEHYWSVGEILQNKEILQQPENELIDQVDALIRESVELRLLSDVPLGGLLSGGIDSTAVVAIMQTLVHQPVKTFTIGFQEKEFDEAPQAKKIAQFLGTEHHEYYVHRNEVVNLLQDAVGCMDEPISDPSLLPTMLVSAYAKNYVTVALSGDGGDEVFFGYNHYLRYASLKRFISLFKLATNRPFSQLLSHFPIQQSKLLGSLSPVRSHYDLYINLLTPARAEELNRILLNWDEEASSKIYRYHTQASSYIDINPKEPVSTAYYDLQTVLPDQLLTKVDRASMRVALETRVPLLDHRLVEFCLTLPFDMLYRDGESKYILRQVLRKYLPESLITRSKKGFSIPLNDWMTEQIRPQLDRYLSREFLNTQGIFRCSSVENITKQFLSKNGRQGRLIWSLLIFQLWYAENLT